MLKVTPFHARTAPLCHSQAWRRWAGYVVASSYELLHDREYHAIRSAAALFDVSPLYKYLIGGGDAVRPLDRGGTRHVTPGQVGHGGYPPWGDGDRQHVDHATRSRLAPHHHRPAAA